MSSKLKNQNKKDTSSKDEVEFLLKVVWPYALRAGRALVYACAGILLYWLQPHFEFGSIAFALAIFLLALISRGQHIAEVALLLIMISIFVPAGFVTTVLASL
jgi:hypothetical protein